MILDQLSLLSDAQTITVSAPSQNVYDLGETGFVTYNAGIGDKPQLKRSFPRSAHIPLLIQVVEDFAGLTALKLKVQSDSNSSFPSPKDLICQDVPLADLKAGFISAIDKVPGEIEERYFRVFFEVVGGPATGGKVTAGIVGAVDESYKG
jgi:hypothetical protein